MSCIYMHLQDSSESFVPKSEQSQLSLSPCTLDAVILYLCVDLLGLLLYIHIFLVLGSPTVGCSTPDRVSLVLIRG